MTVIIFFILGLIIGSFLNAVVYRLRVAESIAHGRSKCPQCQKQIDAGIKVLVLIPHNTDSAARIVSAGLLGHTGKLPP